MGSMYDDTPTSRFEEDMRAIIDGTPWPERPPKSKMEELLEELNDLIKAGGGGGGTSTIAWKPSVASDGTISWTRTASETKPDDQNIKGPKGEDGQDGEDGLGIKQVSINLENHLIITYDDDTTEDAGALPGGGSTTLADLTDTAISSPTNGQVLAYNSTTSKWENADGKTVKAFVKATPAMTSATTPSGVASASSEYNGNYAAWYAFCGTPGNDQQTWATSYGHTTGEWIQYKFDEGVIIKKIATTNRNEGNPRVIRTFIFQGSNDGETYVDLANCEVESNQGHYRQEFLINNDTAYTYYRLYVTEPWVLDDTTVGLAQLEIYKEIEVEITELGDLTDVNIYNASEGQPLIYDAASSQWVNTKVLSTSYGGTGNSSGYIRAGVRENTTIGNRATAEGVNNTVSGENAHAEGQNNTASGVHSHVEGEQCQATDWWAHAEGFQSKAYGRVTHAEGNATTASNYYAHSEGLMSTASGNTSHAEGSGTTASGSCSHSQNEGTTASGARSTAAGYYTNAGYENQFVVGKYNNNKNTSLLEVGNGAGMYNRSNALELDASGNLKVAGTVTDGNGNVLEKSPKVHILDTESTDVSSTTFIPLANISTFPTCEVGDIIVVKVNANYTFNTTAGGYWTFKINNIGYEMRLLWADESDFNQDLPKGSCVVFVYNHNMLYDDFLTVASFDVKNFDPSTVVQKSQTAGLLKNDGTVDTHTYVQTSNTSGLLKNDGTVDTTTYASEAGTESLIDSTVGWTGKNQANIGNSLADGWIALRDSALEIANGDISTKVTATISSNTGSVTVTNYDSSGYWWMGKVLPLKKNTDYYVSGTATWANVRFVGFSSLSAGSRGTNFSYVAGMTFNSGNYDYIVMSFYPSSFTASGLMVSEVTDTTFEPYHKSVEEELSAIHSVPSGGTIGQVLAKVSGTDYDLEWANMAGGAKVHTWETTTTDQSDMWLVLTLTSTPVLVAGDIYVIKVKANYVGYDFQSYGTTTYGIRFTNGGSTVSWTNCISAGVDGSGNDVPFTPDIHEGDVITLLCTNASTPKFLLLSSNKDKEYCEATITLSTSATTTATFYNAGITSDSVLEVGVSEWGLVPDSVSMSSTGIATAVFPAVDSARSVTVRLYIK